jgi:hypothetical protein
VMAKYLERHQDEVNGRALCDLSAGTGLVGAQQPLHRCTNQCNWNLYVTLMLPLCGGVSLLAALLILWAPVQLAVARTFHVAGRPSCQM